MYDVSQVFRFSEIHDRLNYHFLSFYNTYQQKLKHTDYMTTIITAFVQLYHQLCIHLAGGRRTPKRRAKWPLCNRRKGSCCWIGGTEPEGGKKNMWTGEKEGNNFVFSKQLFRPYMHKYQSYHDRFLCPWTGMTDGTASLLVRE